MAKLSDRQKNNIIAKWNTGEYTKIQLAKAYKVNEKTIRDIVGKKEPMNAHIVEASVLVEKAKNSDKSPSEIQAIEQAVKYRLEKEFNADSNKIKIYDVTKDIIDGVSKLIKGGKAQKVVRKGLGLGISSAVPIDYDLQVEHYAKAMDTIDKASVTLKVSERHAPRTEINNNNAQQNNNEIVGYGVKTIED